MKIVMCYNLCNNTDQFLYLEIDKTIINEFRKIKKDYNNNDLIYYMYDNIKDADFYGVSTFYDELDWHPEILEQNKIISTLINNNYSNNLIFQTYYKNMGFELLKFASLFKEKEFSDFLWEKSYYNKFIMPKKYFEQYVQFLNQSLNLIEKEQIKILMSPILTSYFLYKNKENIKNVQVYLMNQNQYSYYKI